MKTGHIYLFHQRLPAYTYHRQHYWRRPDDSLPLLAWLACWDTNPGEQAVYRLRRSDLFRGHSLDYYMLARIQDYPGVRYGTAACSLHRSSLRLENVLIPFPLAIAAGMYDECRVSENKTSDSFVFVQHQSAVGLRDK